MNAYVYIGVVLLVIGLYTWLFASSRLRNMQRSFIPPQAGKIRFFQIINIVGWILFGGGLLMSIIAFCCN